MGITAYSPERGGCECPCIPQKFQYSIFRPKIQLFYSFFTSDTASVRHVHFQIQRDPDDGRDPAEYKLRAAADLPSSLAARRQEMGNVKAIRLELWLNPSPGSLAQAPSKRTLTQPSTMFSSSSRRVYDPPIVSSYA